MSRWLRCAVVAGALFSSGGPAAAQDATQAYRELIRTNGNLFNRIRDAERSQKEEIPGHLDLSSAKEVAEAYANLKVLEPFVESCKAGKYEGAREPVLPPERGCDLAARAGELLKGYLDKIVAQAVRHAQGNGRASLKELEETGCVANLESFYVMAKPDAAQERIAKDVQAVYAKAGLTPPADAGMGDFAKSFEAAVSAAVTNAKPSQPSKPDAASAKAITAAFTKLCKQGSGRNPPRNCSVVKAYMTTDDGEAFKNSLGIPTRRTREGKVLLRLADREHCLRQHAVVAQEYQGGKFGPSTAEVGKGACPVACK